MRSIRTMTLVMTLVMSLGLIAGAAMAGEAACPGQGRVSIHARREPIRVVLQEIFEQSKVTLAFDPHIKGRVSANLECVTIADALNIVLPQVAAEFCASDDVIRISRQGRSRCAHPSPVVEQVRNSNVRSR